ncbi:hypothetical protein BCT69_01415 [Enterovibrio norvegicus]|nr:hypothetical protein BCT69_01415 [Enterovibrio norvegicus]
MIPLFMSRKHEDVSFQIALCKYDPSWNHTSTKNQENASLRVDLSMSIGLRLQFEREKRTAFLF